MITNKDTKAGRFYEIAPGQWAPSITTILTAYPTSYGLQQFFKNSGSAEEADRIRDEAAARGQAVHQRIEQLITTGYCTLSDLPQEQAEMVLRFCDWAKEEKPKFISTERVVVDQLKRSAGRYDLLCEINGSRVCVDYKTSSGVYPSHLIQASMYAKWEEGDNQAAILHLNAKTKKGYKLHLVENLEECQAAFDAVYALYRFDGRPMSPKEEREIPSTIILAEVMK